MTGRIKGDALGVTIRQLLEGAHRVAPDRLAALSAAAAAHLGVEHLRIWLADHDQRCLVPVAGGEASEADFGGGVLDIDSSIAGRVYMSSSAIEVRGEGKLSVWLPLVDGIDRIGVLETVRPDEELDGAARAELETLAAVVAAEVVTRGQYSDAFVRSRRREGMGIAAEVIWQLLPPHTFATSEVSIAGALEPAYEVGGNVFDFAFNTPTLHLAMLDAVGHGLASSLVATLAVTGYRNARRGGASLTDTYGRVDRLLAEHHEDVTFVTGHLAELDTISGELRWINAGHPPPLLVRQGHVVRTLDSHPRPPLGLGNPKAGPVTVTVERLEPGDSVLFYTDGVIEARTPAGVDFGMDRLTDFLERAESTGMAPPEVVRRLSHAVVDHHQGILRDDAATLLVQWHPRARR